jgi:hypothetical protein
VSRPGAVQTGIPLQITGENGNAFSIIARAHRALRLAKLDHLIEEFSAQAKDGDYDHLLQTCMRWFDVR